MDITEISCYSGNIIWKYVDGQIVGKKAIRTKDRRYTWLSNTTPDNVLDWLAGKEANYEETFILTEKYDRDLYFALMPLFPALITLTNEADKAQNKIQEGI